ncbi:DMT family transporter [Psittacicella gerlachiana]|uniref:Guanidinium exporter n=1 Tax=Psittacicella gerlachiana TaxID=2028574 RepID=A0A3A1YJS2_9GAMM|nr:multidrug efflux SMR transporter [Psittacicella gerlachiana]RIY37448.1 hypothetical protein CKF59_01770 [Psittacicella gerlachiana]
MLAWIYLLFAGICEIGWPLGFKIAQNSEHRLLGIAMAIICITLSGFALFLAQKSIPIGTAYAVWTGIGAAGTFIVGVLFFNEPRSFLSWLGVCLIIGGVIALKIANSK